MKLYLIDNGWNHEDKSYFVAGVNAGDIFNENPATKWIDFPIQAFLIEHEEGYILFDTGSDPDWKENWPPFIYEQCPYHATDEQIFMNRLAQLGVRAEDIKYVVCSHLHVDHAGNLQHFKNSEIFVNETELLYTLRGYATGKDLDVHVPSDIEHFLQAKLRWNLIPDDIREYELAKGVTILNLGSGHSFGMMALRVDLEKSGRFLLVSDAIYIRENIIPDIKVPGICYDSLGYKKTAAFLKNYAAKNNCTIIYGHDMEQFRSMRKSHEPNGYYE